jgi:hypothetical protein
VALNELHDHDELTLMTKGGMERGDIGVVESGQQPDLAKKTPDEIIRYRAMRRKDLHGLYSVGDGVAYLKYLSHASDTQGACYFIVADLISNDNGHGLNLTILLGSHL